MARNLLVTADRKRADSVSGLGLDHLLSRELLEHFARAGETIATLADRDVENQFLNTELAHLVFSHFNNLKSKRELWVGYKIKKLSSSIMIIAFINENAER